MPPRTINQAIEDAATAEPHRGFRFVPETGVPGFSTPAGAARRPDDPPEASEASFSFAAIERMSARFGGALQALGLRKGDRVALILPNNDDFVLCFLGAIRAGIIPAPIYPPMALGQLQAYLDNTRHIVAKSGARVLVTTAKIKRLLGTVQSACPALEQVVAIEGIRESSEPLKAEKVGLDDVAFIQFTSGSTSRPKGVTLTHANLAANIKCIMEDGLQSGPEDVGISWLPLYHDMGLIGFVLAPLYHLVPIVYLPALLFLKRPVTWFQAITRHRGSIAYAPNFAYALCIKRIKAAELEGLDLSTWRVAGCGAEPIRPETLEGFADAFAKIGFPREALLPSYGMAESSLAVTFSELSQGVKTISVNGPVLWEKGRAELLAEDADDAVRLVSCGPEFPEHTGPHLPAGRRGERTAPRRGQRGRAARRRSERDARLLGGRGAHPVLLRRPIPQDRRPRLRPRQSHLRLRTQQGDRDRQRPQLLPAGHGVGGEQGRRSAPGKRRGVRRARPERHGAGPGARRARLRGAGA